MKLEHDNMSAFEARAAFSLASIYAFRMLGLFMILPVFALYAHDLTGATPVLIGLALGVYGLTQAIFQIPFGMSSDKFGRKRIITIGLLLFAIGSVIAASSHSITGVIIGRALQGAGAVGSTLIALLADLTREEHRTKAMAVIGMVIGLSFSLAMVGGPILNNLFGVNGIFWLTAGLALVGILMLYIAVPAPEQAMFHRDAEVEPAQLGRILRQPELLRLDVGIFALHGILTASFVVIPVALKDMAGMAESTQWAFYLPIFALAFFSMVPFIIIAEKKYKMKPVFLGAIATLAVAQLGLSLLHNSVWGIGVCLYIFMTAFTLLEASLPSLIAKIAPAGSKGTAMGVYSCSQFFGIFIGGTVGGWLYGLHHVVGVFLFCASLALVWLCLASTMKKPKQVTTYMIKLGQITQEQASQLNQHLMQLAGIHEALIQSDDGIVYLKVDKRVLDKDNLLELVNRYTA
ncbi:MAG: MFS transporter [Legionellales bacterium]|nr:MFS transporter [Legionellales bacterium]